MLLRYLQSCISVSQPIFREKVCKRGFHFFCICVEKNVFLMLNERTVRSKDADELQTAVDIDIYTKHIVYNSCV